MCNVYKSGRTVIKVLVLPVPRVEILDSEGLQKQTHCQNHSCTATQLFDYGKFILFYFPVSPPSYE